MISTTALLMSCLKHENKNMLKKEDKMKNTLIDISIVTLTLIAIISINLTALNMTQNFLLKL